MGNTHSDPRVPFVRNWLKTVSQSIPGGLNTDPVTDEECLKFIKKIDEMRKNGGLA